MSTEETTVAPSINTLPPAAERKADDKVPGLELTWKDCDLLELADSTIEKLVALKREYFKIILIPTGSDLYVARTCTRQEWRQVVAELGDVDESRDRLVKEGKSEAVVTQFLTMIAEDKLVERFLVHPKMSISEIRKLAPGEVKTLHDSIMMGLGYGQAPRAIRI